MITKFQRREASPGWFYTLPSPARLKQSLSQTRKLGTGALGLAHHLPLSSAPLPGGRNCFFSEDHVGEEGRQAGADASRLRAPFLLGQGTRVQRDSPQTKALTASNRNVMV